MKIMILAALAALVVAGCGSSNQPAPDQGTRSTGNQAAAPAPKASFAYDLGTKKKGDRGACVVCGVNGENHGSEEEIAEVLDYKGKTYAFCSEAEKAEFISNPGKYAGK